MPIDKIIHSTDDTDNTSNNEDLKNSSLFKTNINRTIEFYNNPNSDKYKDVQERIANSGLTQSEYRNRFVGQIDRLNGPGAESIDLSMPDNDMNSNIYDFKNSIWDDFSTRFQDGLNRIGYGLQIVIPGISAATQESGTSPDWITDWIDASTDWYQQSKERVSDESNQSFFKTGSARAFAGGLGQGAASMTPMVLSFIPYVGKAAYLATTFSDVFGSILLNGKQNGLSVEDAARMATFLSVPITALEKIGMEGVSAPIKKGVVRKTGMSILDESIKKVAKSKIKNGISKEAFKKFLKVSSKDIGRKKYLKEVSKNIGRGFLHGAKYEGITETLQSIVEQTGEQIFDFTKDSDTKGHYGTDIRNSKFWLQAAEEGFYGSILGGIMSGAGGSLHGVKAQSTYHYVRSSIKNNKPQNIESIKARSKQMVQEGLITQDEHDKYVASVDEMVKYENLMWHKLDDPAAKYQVYNNMVMKDRISEIEASDWLKNQESFSADKKNEITNLLSNIKKDTDKVITAIVNSDTEIANKRKKRNNNLGRKIANEFVNFKEKYNFSPIDVVKVAPEMSKNILKVNKMLPKELQISEINQQQSINEGKINKINNEDKEDKEPEVNNNYGKTHEIDGVSLTEKVLNNEDDFKNDLLVLSQLNENEKEVAIDGLQSKWGINKEAINYLKNNSFESILSKINVKSKKFGKSYQTKDGIKLTEKSLTPDAKKTISEAYGKAITAKDEKTKQKFIDAVADEYGIDKDAMTYLEANPDTTVEQLKEVDNAENNNINEEELKNPKVSNKTTTESLIKQVNEQKDLNEKDLGSILNEADKKGLSSPELIDAIVKRRKKIKSEKEEIQKEIDKKAEANLKAEEKKLKRIQDYLNPKEQRSKKKITSEEQSLIKDNPELYKKIKRHFKKMFPSISVKEVNNLGEKYGAQILARLIQSGIEIDPNKAIQSSLVHEYSHIFLEVLGENHPLVKMGYKLIEGTQFFKDAQRLYPDKTKAKQLNEALTEAIAQDSIEKLKVKLEGSNLNKFQEWLKSIWKKIKSIFKPTAKDITSILARELVLSRKPYNVDLGSLVGMNMDQRVMPVNKKQVETVNVVYGNLVKQLLDFVSDKDSTFSHKNKNDVSIVAYASLMNRYLGEKENPDKYHVKIFDSIDLGLSNDIIPMEILGKNHPLVKIGYELIKKTEFFKDAQKLYPNKTKAEQLNEALTEAISQDSIEKLKAKFKDSNLDVFQRWLKSIKKISEITEFQNKLKENNKEIYDYADTVVDSMFKTNLELDKEEDIDTEADQESEFENKNSNSAIKATKKVSLSVRSILSSIVDAKGNKIGDDTVFSYIANLAEKTYKKEGLVKALEENVLKDPIAKRVIDIINVLTDEQKAGFLQEISSLVQIKSEGANFRIIENEDGTKEYALRNPIRNKDNTYNGLEDRFTSLTNEQKEFLEFNNIINYDVVDFYTKGVETTKFNEFLDELSDIFNTEITSNDLRNIINQFSETKKSKLQNFFYFLGGQYDSVLNVANKEIPFTNITGYVDNVFNGLDVTLLNNTYLNGANNTVTTTQLGHWVSTLNSMLMNKESGRMREMEKSDVYKNNPVLKYFKEKGRVGFSVFDSLKNFKTNKNVEYKDMTDRDYMMLQLFKFATSSSTEYYSQTLGVKSNRQSITFFESPSYTDSKTKKFSKAKLRKAYDDQVKMLEPMLKDMLSKAKTQKAKNDLINDFNDLYIHSADSKGNITNALDNQQKFRNKIKEIKSIAINNELQEAFSKKVGKTKQFSSFDEMVKAFFYIEAINRSSLNDIYGGVALRYSNLVADTDKGGVQQSVKRLSPADSNGKQLEVDKIVHYIVYDSKDSNSDSFKFNGTHLTEHIAKETGSLDPVGINSKELAYQVDPKTGDTVYIKSSGLNLKVNPDGTTNLDGFGDNMKTVAKIMLDVEKMLATEEDPNPYVVFMDSKASKGTYDFKTVNYNDLVNGDISSIKGAVNSIKIDNLTTPFNLNKELQKVEEQKAILSTQAALIQFNANNDIETFENAAVDYLKGKMQNKFTKKNIIDYLLNHDNVVDELTKDLNDREKSATTEILEDIKNYNKNNPKNKIKTFDHPSLKAIYEQFIASRLSKKAIKIEMSGNFMHQLPDMGGKGRKLKGKEVAVSWKMFFNENPFLDKENGKKIMDDFIASKNNKVAVVRIPASAEMSMFAGKVAYFLDTDANAVVLSDEFVDRSDSDHDGDKAMVYRKEIKNGEFVSAEESSLTKMFETFYENLSSPEFQAKQENTLSLDPLHETVGEEDSEFSTSTVNDMVKVAKKLGLGETAVGRFAIAGKLMSLLSQSNERLYKAIKFNSKKLQDFTNKSLDDLAIFLQAALDIGNDPILSNTGFNETTINIGNSMLLLGLNKNEVIKFLKDPDIINMVEGFKKENLALSTNEDVSFDDYFNKIFKYYGKDKSEYQIENTMVNGRPLGERGRLVLSKYQEFKTVADGLSKMIGFIQLDKGLSNNAKLNRQLLENIKSFRELPFTTRSIVNRALKVHQHEIAKAQNNIYENQLLTETRSVVSAIEHIAEFTNNPFKFKEKISESVMKIFAQNQINTKRDNVKTWFYDFPNKLEGIKKFNKNGETNIVVDEDQMINDNVKAIYDDIQANPLIAKDDAIMKFVRSLGGNETMLPKYQTLLSKYEDAVDDVGMADKFKGNKFFDYLQFTKDDKGRTLMSLDPKFKATSQIIKDVKKGFKEIQDVAPDIAKDIIDYQLYRYGTNNKIGSFIDVLPMEINRNQLIETTKFKEKIDEALPADAQRMIREKFTDNLIADNKEYLEEVNYNSDIDKIDHINGDWFKPNTKSLIDKNGKQLPYVNFNNTVYKYNGVTYNKLSNIQSDENFVSFYNNQSTIKETKQQSFGKSENKTNNENETIGVKVDSTKSWYNLKNQPVYTKEGVNTMRTSNKEAEYKHFGNPFSEAGYRGTIKVNSIEEAKQAYKDWLLTDKFNNVKQKQRQWILEQINSGKLDNAILLYSAKLAGRGKGSHADMLAEVVKELRGNQINNENKNLPNEFLLDNGVIVTAPKVDTPIDIRGGKYLVTNNMEIINKTPGSVNLGKTVLHGSPIFYDIIDEFQRIQAEEQQKNCS